MPLMLLAGFVNTFAIWAACRVKQKASLFFALVLILFAAQIGVFAARDLLLFFLMWELELIVVSIDLTFGSGLP